MFKFVRDIYNAKYYGKGGWSLRKKITKLRVRRKQLKRGKKNGRKLHKKTGEKALKTPNFAQPVANLFVGEK